MNCRKAISIVFACTLLLINSVYAQYKFDKAVSLDKKNGLPSNIVRTVKKSDDGFMWIGTDEGLCRFDGQQFKVYSQSSDTLHSLIDNVVYAILPYKDQIWVGTKQGVSILNTTTQTFKHYQLNDGGKSDSITRRFDQVVYNIVKDRNGDIWIGTRARGIYKYIKSKDDFIYFPVPKDKYPPLSPSLGGESTILSIEQHNTNDSIIWAGTPSGLQEINKYTRDVKFYTFPQKVIDYQVAVNAFRRLYHHHDGLLYVGSWGAGINVFDPVKKTFTPIEYKNDEATRLLSSTISGIKRKNDHEFWITTGAGLAIYDSNEKDVTWLKYNDASENEFYGIDMIDEDNRVWYSYFKGLEYFDPAMQQFSMYRYKKLGGPAWGFVFYIVPDKTGENIAVCPRITDGVYFFNKDKKSWKKFEFPQSRVFDNESDVIRGFVKIAENEYVISSYKGIYKFNIEKNIITDITRKISKEPTRWGSVLLDKRGVLWIASDGHGLISWNPTTEKKREYTEVLKKGDPDNQIARVINLFEDSKGNIWFERTGGFGVRVSDRDTILTFIYAKNNKNSFPVVSCFAEDKRGRVWLSSDEGWLGYADINDPSRGLVSKLNLIEQGFSGSLPLLASDKNGDIWGYTKDQLIKMNADNLEFTGYNFSYGIDEAEFYNFSFLASGEIILGGRSEIVITNPTELKRNTEIPIPYVEDVRIANQSIGYLSDGSPLRLKYKQNFFSINFSAKAFTMPDQVKFRYRLSGFDEWNEVVGHYNANYTNVPGGDYVFQLQAANNEGVWNKDSFELPVHVVTPFWLTWWFRIGVAILVLSGVYFFYRYRINQVSKKQQLKRDYEKKLANVEMSALLAQMNPHFLFNCLNSIDSYIIRNESKKASEYLNNFARLMRLILQNSRSNYISLKDELEALELYMQMESLRFKNKFSYSINIDERVDTSSIVIPPMLIQPYVENAIWHGLMHKTNGEEGRVNINLFKEKDDLQCVIEDNGIGRKQAAEFKSQRQMNHKRSMGMQITKDRIEIINKLYNMNASINIYDREDEKGKAIGTKVELTIPV